MLGRLLLCGSTAADSALLLNPLPAAAHNPRDSNARVPSATASPEASAAAPEVSSPAPQEGTSSDIVVTATRQNRSLLNTPAAVSVLTSQTIEKAGVTRPGDIVAFVPNFNIQALDRAGEAFVSVRGIAQTRSADGVIAVVVDGVQLASPEELNQELFDVAQIEVLKGPQGALYGRNAIGGALVITTKPPSDEFQAVGTISYANADAVRATASLNVPISVDKAYLRVSAYQRVNDGYFFNATTQRNVDPSNERGGRVRLDLLPTPELKISLRGNASRFRGSAVNYVAQFGRLDTDDTSIPFTSNVIGRDRQSRNGAAAVIDYNVGPGHVVLTPAYSYVRERVAADGFPYLPSADTTQRAQFLDRTKTVELKFVSTPTKAGFGFIVGGYYAHIDHQNSVTTGQDTGQGFVIDGIGPFGPASGNPTLAIVDNRYKYDVLAGFGQVTVPLTSEVTLAGALRYDNERRRQTDVSPPAFDPFSGLVRRRTFNGAEPKVTLSYKPTPTVNLYADYSQGFVSGGFNPPNTRTLVTASDPNATVPNEYGKQVNKALEIGAKTALLDRHLLLNLAAFRSRVSNLQQFQFFPAATLQAINPIDRSHIRGVEADATVRIDPVTLFLGVGLTEAKINSYPAAPAFAGNKVPYVPSSTLNAGVEYGFKLSGKLRGNVRVDYQRLGPQWFDIANTPGSRRSAVDLVNARLNVGSDDWTLSAFGKNVLDKRYNAEAVVVLPELQALTPALPATYGVELTIRY